MRLPCSLFWRLAAFVGVLSVGTLVDALRATVTVATGTDTQAAQTFCVQMGTDRGLTPSSVTVPFQTLLDLRATLRRLDSAPKTRPFPNPEVDGGDEGGDRDAATLELWLEDVLGRWWNLPDGAKEALAFVLGFEVTAAGRGPAVQQDIRRRIFSIDATRESGGANLRAPLLSWS
jgi:hypothetical protein